MSRTTGRSSLYGLLASGIALAVLTGCGHSNLYNVTQPQSIVIEDFAGTGYPGIALAQAQLDESGTNLKEQPGYVAIILQKPGSPGSFDNPVHFPTQGNPFGMAAGDITGTGAVDLAVANGNDSTISVLFETAPGSATFKTVQNISTTPPGAPTTTPDDVAICDIQGDGYPDLIVADAGAPINAEDISTYSAIGAITTNGNIIDIPQNPASPGTFGTPVVLSPAPTPAADESPTPTANAIYGLACASLSSTSPTAPPDIVFTSYDFEGNNGTLSILFHDPANPGHFLPRFDISVPGLVARIKIADVNDDGLPDIVLSDEGAGEDGTGTAGIVVLLQNPAAPGTFEGGIVYGVYSANSFAIGDVNGDGYPDIVSTSSYPSGTGTVSILFNTPATPGTFSSTPTEYSALGNPDATAIGPLSGKPLNDIAVGDSTGAAVLINQTATPGSFEGETLVGG